MEDLFLNITQALSDSRFWLFPLLFLCTLVMIIDTIADIANDD